MQFSSLPLLIAVLFGFLWFLVRRLRQKGGLSSAQRNQLTLLIATLLVWGLFVGYLASERRYNGDSLNLLQGYWIPCVPVVFAVTMTLFLAPLRDGLRVLVDETPAHWLSGIHTIRILALVTLIKASNDLFPQLFAWFVGGTDMLLGLSAVLVTLLARAGKLTDGILLFWHLAGAVVIVLSVAGPMYLFTEEFQFAVLFEFPMVMASALVVPTLLMLNMIVAWRLWENRKSRLKAGGSL
jgi:hypothetical protein